MPKRQSTDRLLAQAQRAIEQDQLANARVLLEAAARQDATDARPWLLLAGIAGSARERRTFLAQADRLKTAPGVLAPAPLGGAPVRGRVSAGAAAVPATLAYPAPRPARRSALLRSGLVVAVLMVLALGAYLLAQSPVGEALVQDLTGGPMAQPDTVLAAADATPDADTQPTAESAQPTPTLAVALSARETDALAPDDLLPDAEEPAAEPPLLPEKNLSAAGQTLATWTVTPQPTPTLAPTATPTATPEPTATLEPPPPGSPRPLGVGPAEKWIDVNLTTQTLTAYEGDTPVLTTLISSGRWEYQTVTGEFRTYLKYDMQTMSGYHLGLDYVTTDVPNVMYFYRDFAIHGAYWHNSFGTPVSHGCVNAPPPEAAWLYAWAPVGTFVTVHY